MDRKVSVRIDSVQCQLDDLSDAVFINLMHTERFDVIFLQDALLAGIDVSKTDVHESVSFQYGFDPGELGHASCNAKKEGHRHAVNIPCRVERSVSKVRWAADI